MEVFLAAMSAPGKKISMRVELLWHGSAMKTVEIKHALAKQCKMSGLRLAELRRRALMLSFMLSHILAYASAMNCRAAT